MRKRAVCLVGVLSPLIAFAASPVVTEGPLEKWAVASRGPVIWVALGVAIAGREWFSRWRGNEPWSWLTAPGSEERDQRE